MEKRNLIILIIVLVLAFVGYEFFGKKSVSAISLEEAQTKIEALIKMNPTNTAVIKSIIEEDGLYKITVTVDGQEFSSYMSKDGKKFFPEAIDLEAVINLQEEATQPEVSVKSDKPVVELFVMSHCPYGTQVEKGILPVVETLGDKIDFELKFCDYSMHDKLELDEQVQQYCIKEQSEKTFLDYLKCFLKEGNSSACLAETKVDATSLQACIANTENEYKVTENYNDKTTWTQSTPSYPTFNLYKEDNSKYQVGGSPTLIINGKETTSNRDANSLLKVICSAFNEAPSECEQILSTEIPAPGFGSSTTEDTTNASCN